MTEIVSRHDGFSLSAHHVAATGARKGGVVVIQEIFGLTDHIKAICATCAGQGYEAIAPSLFDRVERGFLVDVNAEGIERGRNAVGAASWEQVAGDVQAAIDALAPPVFIVGFCYGGVVAWLAAQRCNGLSAASGFYGGRIGQLLDRPPRIPIILHYGEHDAGIPMSEVDKVRTAFPAVPIHVYDAGHGFCREGSHDFHAPSRDLALQRTFDLFAQHSA